VFQRNWRSGIRRSLNHSRDKPLLVILCTSISCSQDQLIRPLDRFLCRRRFLERSSKWP
jgi:hypothetical protein